MKYFGFVGILLYFLASSLEPRPHLQVVDEVTEVDLGKMLFFDTLLSRDSTISCSSCHNPQFAYADNKAFSIGVADSIGLRNTPSVMNMAYRPYFFYDGRAATLEEQVKVPIEDPREMHLLYNEAVARVQNNDLYDSLFQLVYDQSPNGDNIAQSISEFQRSLESDGSSAFDQWMNDEDLNALTESQLRGRELFISDEMRCFDCHFGPDFTGDEFRSIGLYNGEELNDVGRFAITQDSADIGKFKVPTLRNIALTAPYMHNGMFETLEEVIDYYSNPYDVVKNPINMDSTMIEPLNLTDQQKKDFVNFLVSLTDEYIPHRD